MGRACSLDLVCSSRNVYRMKIIFKAFHGMLAGRYTDRSHGSRQNNRHPIDFVVPSHRQNYLRLKIAIPSRLQKSDPSCRTALSRQMKFTVSSRRENIVYITVPSRREKICMLSCPPEKNISPSRPAATTVPVSLRCRDGNFFCQICTMYVVVFSRTVIVFVFEIHIYKLRQCNDEYPILLLHVVYPKHRH